MSSKIVKAHRRRIFMPDFRDELYITIFTVDIIWSTNKPNI